MAQLYKVTIEIKANNENEALERVALYQGFNEYIALKNLKYLHEKCKKHGTKINDKIEGIPNWAL
jgi:hypothetical protein